MMVSTLSWIAAICGKFGVTVDYAFQDIEGAAGRQN